MEFFTTQAPGYVNELPSLLEAIRNLDGYEEGFCRIHAASVDLGVPNLRFYFRWEPSGLVVAEDDSELRDDPANVFYERGEKALTLGENDAFLYFSCDVAGREGHLLTARLHMKPGAEPDDRMALLNSLSRSVAEGLGCLEESGLTDADPREMERRGTPGANGSGVPDDAQSP
ncbi:hypothetical protein [Streptomyces marincola]|uniref:hypothetical protein n=1 Tax=Streptomyces marincola TaxID=2878388 RepID=UPI001CF24333|nr:hypothetical protein [Streptomyces marincola]UCM90579.1 hypothetical protein LC193_23035 [Streptomyces marincola]